MTMFMESRLKTVSPVVHADTLKETLSRYASLRSTTKIPLGIVSPRSITNSRAKYLDTNISKMICLRLTPQIWNKPDSSNSPTRFLNLFQNKCYESDSRSQLSEDGQTSISNFFCFSRSLSRPLPNRDSE